MEQEFCLREEAELVAFERVAADPPRRRELLWLRAMEEEDDESARDLERVDPGLAGRMSAVVAELATARIESSRDRRDWFARQWSACHDRHVRELLPYTCTCTRCVLCREC